MLEGWQGEHAASVGHYRQAAEFTAALGSVEDEVHFRLFMARELWLLGERDRAGTSWPGPNVTPNVSVSPRSWPWPPIPPATWPGWKASRSGPGPPCSGPWTWAARPDISQQIRAIAATGLGYLAGQDGDLDAARDWHAQALAAARTAADAPVIANAMIGFADLALREDDPERAAELIGATSGSGEPRTVRP